MGRGWRGRAASGKMRVARREGGSEDSVVKRMSVWVMVEGGMDQ